MKTWLVDTNILLDVIGADPEFGPTSKAALAHCAEQGTLVINPVIYAEVGVWIPAIEELDSLLPRQLFRREPVPWEGAYLAARAFGRYRRAGGARRRMLADFLIGGHATAAGHAVLSRDRGYGHYFNMTTEHPAELTGR